MEPWEIEWFSAAPAVVGQYDWLLFRKDGHFSGFALVRVYEGKEYRRGQIVHFQTSDDNPEIIYRDARLNVRPSSESRGSTDLGQILRRKILPEFD